MIIDVILGDPLPDNAVIPVEVIQVDFVPGEVQVNVTTEVVRI